ncbi:MAG: glycosyltransferase [Pseudomonadales bacterium]
MPLIVSVVIPVKDDFDRLELCLSALEGQNYPRDLFEIIVVDNNSVGDIAVVSTLFPKVSFLFEGAVGSYAARNKAIAASKGSLLAFTDSDCIPGPSWIEAGVLAFSCDAELSMLAGKIELFTASKNKLTSVELYELAFAFNQKKYLEERHYGATANVFARRELISSVGKFNASLYSGGDKEWGLRVYQAGFKQVYSREVVVSHPARRSYWEYFRKLRRVTKGARDIKDHIIGGSDLLALQPKSSSYHSLRYLMERLEGMSIWRKIRVLWIVGLTFVFTKILYISGAINFR